HYAALALPSGAAAHAAERRQVEKALVVLFRVFPDEEAGAADVVGIGEADEEAVTRGRRAAQGQERQGAVALAAAAVDEFHAQGGARVAAGVAVLGDAGRSVRRGGEGR